MRNEKLRVLIEGAIIVALAQALSYIPTAIGPYFNISLGMIPMTLFALRRGLKYGVFTGLLYGLLKIVIGDIFWLHFLQGMIEYTLPYFSIGFAGIMTPYILSAIKKQKTYRTYLYIIIGAFIAGVSRYFWHFIAGVVYWGEYAPDHMSPFTYSLLVNGGHMVATVIAIIIVLILLHSKSKRVFVPKIINNHAAINHR